jgi:L-amino acid N-acyltransferase YncA
MTTRSATLADADAIARIYTEGIEDRGSTFDTHAHTGTEIAAWFDGEHPIVVAERDGAVVGFASSSTYIDTPWYAGVWHFDVYVARAWRGRGVGRESMERLIAECETAGCWKLVSRIMSTNDPSRRLMEALGFREVGIHRNHGWLEGTWRDVVIVEKLLGEAARAATERAAVARDEERAAQAGADAGD